MAESSEEGSAAEAKRVTAYEGLFCTRKIGCEQIQLFNELGLSLPEARIC